MSRLLINIPLSISINGGYFLIKVKLYPARADVSNKSDAFTKGNCLKIKTEALPIETCCYSQGGINRTSIT